MCSLRGPCLRPAAHTPHHPRPNAGSHCWRHSRNSDQHPEQWRWLLPVTHRGQMHPRLEHRSNTLECHKHLEESSGSLKHHGTRWGTGGCAKPLLLIMWHVAKMAPVLGVRLLLVWPSELSAWGVLIWGDVKVDCKQIMQLTGGGYRLPEAGETYTRRVQLRARTCAPVLSMVQGQVSMNKSARVFQKCVKFPSLDVHLFPLLPFCCAGSSPDHL